MNKKILLALAVLSTAFMAVPAHAAVTRPMNPPCPSLSTTCSPGPGWTKVEIKHISSNMCMADSGQTLAQILVELCTDALPEQTWWTRLINGGVDTQYTQVGIDGYFHDMGFSGGAWKLETPGAGQYVVNWDEVNGGWAYANQSEQLFMGDPAQEDTYILEDIDPLTHWVQDTPFCC